MDFTKCSYEKIAARRAAYLLTTATALDGMWENAFLPMAEHWEIEQNEQCIGFCSVNSDGKMLGFVCYDTTLQRRVFTSCLETLRASGAFVSTAEPAYLSLCSDHQSSMTVHALMYEESNVDPTDYPAPPGMEFRVAVPNDLDDAVSFGVAAIKADRGWLSGYFDERITKAELFGLWNGTELVATGECRISPNQSSIADVGMIVGVQHRKQGLATLMLQKLRHAGRRRGLKSICSTESGNVGAQKAIERAGYISQHRILQFSF